MNRNLISLPVIAAFPLAAAHVFGQSSQAPLGLEEPAKTSVNQFRVSSRLGYNISAHFENIGISSGQHIPQPPPPRDPSKHFESATGFTYQDGYVGIDESGNSPGPGGTEPRSIYWGYANKNQIADLDHDGIKDTLLLHRSASGTLFADFQNDPQVGMEINYSRQLGVYQRTRWGIEGAFTYTALDLRSSGIADPRLLRVDAFPLGGIIPPEEPPNSPLNYEYAGPFEYPQPGQTGRPALVAAPTLYTVGIVSRFEASIYGMKMGPYFEFPLANRLSFTLNGGFALLIADGEFRIDQKLAISSPVITSGRLKDSEVGVLPGAYIGGRLTLLASDVMSVFTGLEFESTGHHSQTLRDKRIDVDFWNSLYWTFGVSYSF